MTQTKAEKQFANFTNLYPVTKTLKFELIPIGQTNQMIIDNQVVQIDKNRQIAYIKIKPYFDRLHREFIQESLQNARIEGINEYFAIYKDYKSNKDNKKTIESNKKYLREQIVSCFNVTARKWVMEKYSQLKIKHVNIDILFEEEVFQILKSRYGNESETTIINETNNDSISIFDQWKGFTGYFKKFFETRKNFYKADGTSTALATRIVDQNLDRFLSNIIIFQTIKDKIDITEVENFFDLKANVVFSPEFYNKCLLQIGIDKYNDFLGGKTLNNGEKIPGVNELVNKYRQDNRSQKLPFLKKLDKQLLSQKVKFSYEIETQEELISHLKEFFNSADNKISTIKTLLTNFFINFDQYDINGIYISKEALNTIFHKWTTETDTFNDNLYDTLKNQNLVSTFSRKKDGGYSFPDFVSLSNIKITLEKIPADSKFWKDRYYEVDNLLLNDINSTWIQFVKIFEFEFNSHFERNIQEISSGGYIKAGYDIFKSQFEDLINDFKLDKYSKEVIKNFLDEVLYIYQIAKYFALEKKRVWVTEYDDQLDDFYTNPYVGYLKFYENAYEEIVQPYNKIRNYLTKKTYSENKWILNFENPTLADGWDKNKESDNTAVILRKDDKYYLGIMKKGHNQIFSDKYKDNYQSNIGSEYYEKLVYKLLPDPSKMLPKVCFSKKGLDFFNPKDEILQIYQNNEFKKGDTFSIKSMQSLISFYRDCLELYPGWQFYDFSNVRQPNEYNTNISEFYSDIAKSGYRIWFEKVSKKYIEEKNTLGELYLFQIYNKDFSLKSSGSKNLHTLYFEKLFSKENSDAEFTIKLNGEAEIFYRPKSLELTSEKRNFKREVINKKRYTENKIFFHVPITLNRISQNSNKVNVQINDYIANNTDINIIGVDRGEKHLVYYSVINQAGKILDRGSLNTINSVNYHNMLEKRAQNREKARIDWQDIEGIKDLKKGYSSQVVRKLADLAIKYSAIIVMEDLNMRFKQIRGGIEKSAYQQLEKALIDKLNFLVDKNQKDSNKPGHILKAYQLSAPFETFKDMGKQTGIIFYTQASYTSRIDPLTGWHPNIYLKYSNANKAKEDILKFNDIKFNVQGNRFEFTYDNKNFLNKNEYPNKTMWTVCSSVERFFWKNNQHKYDHYDNLTDPLKSLFNEYKINCNSNILEQIQNIEIKGNEKLFKNLIFYFGLICQIRNTQKDKNGDESDFILSPVEPFFDSRKSQDFGENYPKNGDDNGAYNIARKGILILNKISDFYIRNGTTDKLIWNDLYISNVEWDDFTTKLG